MHDNPILVEVTRGALVESVHRGAYAVYHARGGLAAAAGDIARPIYPRSAIKPLQAIALIETGAAAAFGLGVAIKIDDGATRAAEAVLGALLTRYHALPAAPPRVITNWAGTAVGEIRASL